ncbi:PTS lactose/cellobiose transporter subunit IIA [Spiroplasma clarkii]|uniref:PTS system, cellobiose-specific IIA component n=1 Tax=Spiroplasma clarkii TaxID=2139 RepID=A0A2K8KJ18_9MOLU|nr:PTS lactose/cellobiose transporter subunit IIA [Spiroplasma clarkii]ATX71232.1 PTS system, cellobiose-specific IIA component [Spiroplasma clarkii]
MLDYEKISMEIIINSGVAKSNAIQALKETKVKEFEKANALLKEAKEHLIVASKEHFEIIQKEALGEKIEFKLLLMHAEDQMLNAQTTVDLAEAVIDLFKD